MWNESSIFGKLGVLIDQVRDKRLNETTLAAVGIIIVRANTLVSDCLDTRGMCDDLVLKIETTWEIQLDFNPEPLTITDLAQEILRRLPSQCTHEV